MFTQRCCRFFGCLDDDSLLVTSEEELSEQEIENDDTIASANLSAAACAKLQVEIAHATPGDNLLCRTIPEPLILMIFMLLDLADFAQIPCVSKYFHRLSLDERLWQFRFVKLWGLGWYNIVQETKLDRSWKSIVQERWIMEVRYDNTVKVLLVGPSGVGKTAAVIRFTSNIFDWDQPSTFALDCYARSIVVDQQIVRVQVMDPGYQYFCKAKSKICSVADAVIVFVDSTSTKSLAIVDELMREISTFINSKVVLFAETKCDHEDEIVVGDEQLKALAKIYLARVIKISSLSGENIEEMFTDVSRDIIQLRESI